jgi:hypothetical protein
MRTEYVELVPFTFTSVICDLSQQKEEVKKKIDRPLNTVFYKSLWRTSFFIALARVIEKLEEGF